MSSSSNKNNNSNKPTPMKGASVIGKKFAVCVVILLVLRMSIMQWENLNSQLTYILLQTANEAGEQQNQQRTTSYQQQQQLQQQLQPQEESKRFAIVSGFVAKTPTAKVEEKFMPHLINKACYAYLWDYDFIFNTTWGFTARSVEDTHPEQFWLDFGTWHRVPHMLAALDKYEWILYADVDYLVQDMGRPLESFIKEWQFHDLDVHVFVPTDQEGGLHTFSAYAVMIKNSPFGRRMLENWNEFAHGLCPKGNINKTVGKYDWQLTDQPGIWYSLARTHAEFYNKTYNGAHCNEHGFLNTTRAMGPELNQYMREVGKLTKYSENLDKVPRDQPIIWSPTTGGLGVQQTYTAKADMTFEHAFALHRKDNLPPNILQGVERCKQLHNCTAGYVIGTEGKENLDVRCGSQSNRVF